jgi:ABC-type multidrug transport system fused ATPase/permease subunit
MIKELFRVYKRQIFFAFALVIIENVTFIAEPYIFGQAIDNLREAKVIEEEVDSTIANSVIRQAIDSVREHLIDSLAHEQDSLEEIDSSESSLLWEEQPTTVTNDVKFVPAVFIQGEESGERKTLTLPAWREQQIRRRVRRDSLREELDKNFEAVSQATTDSARREKLRKLELPPSTQRNIRRLFNERDSLRALLRKQNPKTSRQKASRDSLRTELKKKPHERKTVMKEFKGEKPPVSFIFPKDLGPFLPALIPWIILYVISSGVGALRRYYDTKIYTRMFADLSSNVVEQQLKAGEDLSKIAGRSNLAWHNIEFFQYNLPEFLEQVISVGGAVIALSLFDWRLAAVGGVLLVVVLSSSQRYMRRVEKYQSKLNDLREEEYDTFATKDPDSIRAFYNRSSVLETKLSELGMWSHVILRGLLLVMFLGTLYISLDLDRFTIGELYSIVAYVWTFVTASEYMPYLSERWVALRDTSKRLRAGELLGMEE